MTSDPPRGRLLPLLTADGPTQMAIDALLLKQAQTNPVLRFYRWYGPWLSIGRHQRQYPEHWNALAAAGALSIVRRPSGGSAVLHAGGLTYALIWPNAPRQRHQAYREACRWLIDGFRQLGEELYFGDEAAIANVAHCFARATAADLVDRRGIKRIGSAQRWQHGNLLQHGEILLDPPSNLWQQVFKESGPISASDLVPRDGLDQHLFKALQHQWPDQIWHEQDFNDVERQTLGLTKSGSVACIDSTT